MKIAINNIPLKSAHNTRGIGYYTNHLLDVFSRDRSLDIQEFSNLDEVKNADVIHYPWFDLFFHTLPITKRFPTIVTIHDVIPLIFSRNYPVGFKGRMNFMLQKIALNNFRHIITYSIVSKVDIVRFLKFKESKITVIPLAADERFKLLRSSTKLLYIKRQYHLSDRFLLYVGDCINCLKPSIKKGKFLT